jgi:hypothetical protein
MLTILLFPSFGFKIKGVAAQPSREKGIAATTNEFSSIAN